MCSNTCENNEDCLSNYCNLDGVCAENPCDSITCSIHLKNHALNDKEGIDSMIENMADYLKSRKKLKKKPQIIETDDIERIKSKYNLPDTMNSNIFVNLEIKE